MKLFHGESRRRPTFRDNGVHGCKISLPYAGFRARQDGVSEGVGQQAQCTQPPPSLAKPSGPIIYQKTDLRQSYQAAQSHGLQPHYVLMHSEATFHFHQAEGCTTAIWTNNVWGPKCARAMDRSNLALPRGHMPGRPSLSANTSCVRSSSRVSIPHLPGKIPALKVLQQVSYDVAGVHSAPVALCPSYIY